MAVGEPYMRPAMAATEQSPARDTEAMAAMRVQIMAAAAHLPPPQLMPLAAARMGEDAEGDNQEGAVMQLSPMATAARLSSALNAKFQTAGRVANSGDQTVEGLNLLGHAAGPDNVNTSAPKTPRPMESASNPSAAASSEAQSETSNALLMWPPTPPSKIAQNAAQLGASEPSNREREEQGESGGQ